MTISPAFAPGSSNAQRERRLPLSSAQLRLWLLEQIDAGVQDAYHISGALEFRGRLDEEALRRSLDALMARHDVLRATVMEIDGQAVQHIPPELRFAWRTEDLRHLSGPALEAERRRQIEEECGARFDLRAGPLIRGRLLRIAGDRHTLVLSLHHMVTDGLSTAILMRDVAAFYTAFVQGLPDPLPPLQAQYADHVQEERERASSSTRQTRLDFWRRQLQGAPELLELPTDRPRPPLQSHAGDRVDMVFPAPLLATLRAWARRRDATLPMVLHAGLSVLLARLSGQGDIVIGMPVANRRRAAYRQLMGFFVNTLALRVDLADNPSGAELVERVRAVAQAAYLRQDVPFEQIVETVQPARNPSHSPVFQVLLVMHNFDTEVIELPDATLQLAEVPPRSVPWDLAVVLRETSDGMVGRFAYAAGLFDRETVQRWTGYFLRLLGAMASDETRRVADLEMLDDAERALLLGGFDEAPMPLPAQPRVHALFEAQAARTPEALALVDEQRSWRYAELEREANRLAQRLRAAGVAADDRVALFVARGAELVIAMLAVLKSGGAYVPLDPADPPERIARMLGDAKPRVVLTQERLRSVLPPLRARLLLLEAESEAEARSPEISPSKDPTAAAAHDPLAYVVYTSGSTGDPKGVAMPHSALVNLIEWQARSRPQPRAPRTLQYVAIGFDVAFQEIFTTLCGGGTLVTVRESTRRDMGALLRLLREQHIERLILPFVSLQHLAEEAAVMNAPLPALREVITGGEPLRIGTEIRDLFKRLGDCRLQNQYGPTEYPVATALDLDGPPDGWPLLPSIGRPIANTRVRVLDAQHRLQPIGVKGEIYLGGAGMARGYLHQPDATSAGFVTDPFHADPAARLYKTGDIGRWRADGHLEYLSREDDQVKLRGFRIELGEIEAQIGRHPGVGDVAVVLREDRPGDKRLVAYVAKAAGSPLDESKLVKRLRTHLRHLLPDYMLPGAYVVLPALPLTASGKLDRRALPPPQAHAGGERVMPRHRTEEMIWEIWRDVLHSTAFGVEDSFFELGGHSLMTMQVASRVRERLDIDMPLATLFEHVTIAELAAWIDQRLAGRPSPARASIPRVPRGGPLPVSLSQRRMWVIQQFDPASVAYNVAVTLRLRGPLDRELLQGALDALVARHEGLRTHFVLHEDEPAQVIAPAAGAAIDRIDLRTLPSGERVAAARSVLRDRVAAPFDLTKAPLHHATLVLLGDEDHVLLWLLHHAITDNWSVAILMRELLEVYASLKAGHAPELPALRIEYADYAAWQRSPEAVAQRHHEMDYWVGRLRGLQRLDLPTDYPRPQRPTFRGSLVAATLPQTLREHLHDFCGRHGTTPFVVLLAAFKLMLARHANGSDIAVGTPIANRHRLATEQLVGTLVNTLVMRTDLSGDPDFAELVRRVRKTALDAYAHQDAPFDELVEVLGQDRVAQPEGLVRTLFNVLNAPLGRLTPVEFSAEEFELEHTAAQFDLSMHVDTEFGHRIYLEYSTDLYARESAQRMLENYLALVEEALGDPARPLSRYSMVTPAQWVLLRDGWNATQHPLPPQLLVHRHLRVGEAGLCDRIAVVDADGRATAYGQLEARSNVLAHALRARGIGRGHRVGLCVARDAGMVAAQLGVLKSGAAYVPLDPAFPVERLRYMASDGALSAILVPPELASPFADTGAALVDPHCPDFIAGASSEPLPPDAGRDAGPLDAAYMIYTSGSTGKPKAVAVPHRAVVNFLAAMARTPGLLETDRLLAVTTLSFDIAVLELLLPLAVGAQIVIADREQVSDPAQLHALLERHAVTVMQATPATWRSLIEAGWTGAAGFRALIGGEPLQPALADQLMERTAALWNMYGPTETTVWSTCWQVQSPREGISIGRPIANTSVWILDANGQPCPIGVPGEACIGGLGVALGYHGREALSAERFVPDPWGDEPGARLYRTGDLCRWRHDGVLEHMGRLDHQVKVRGFRIELGEIESVLLGHPAVAQCVVVTRAEREDDVRLVGYVVLREGEGEGHGASHALREHLRSELPEYMVPQHLVALPALPLLPNGKIDRSALPAPDIEVARPASRAWLAPETHEEKAIAAIWAELLGIDRVAATDNFFDLGGHSLLAMRAVIAAEKQLGWRIAPRRLVFETLRQVANPAHEKR